MWSEGIDVEISTMVETLSGRAAREASNKLHIDVMRFAQAQGLTLARATVPIVEETAAGTQTTADIVLPLRV